MFRFFRENIHISILLLSGFVLRFSISAIHTYSSDELSAINRLDYDSLGELIQYGIKEGDMHPAGVQLFEKFWTAVFGTSEPLLRFPFVVMGVLSIWLTYRIGKDWMGKNAGIIGAALLTITYFPIIQSELARPYSPGLLFSLMVGFFWLRLLFPRSTRDVASTWKNALFLGLSYALAMYTHYFAFLFVGFIGLSGLFFIRKENTLPYLVSGLLAVVLFLPHIGITVTHFSVEGGLQWLGHTSLLWIVDFIFYAFNESTFVLIVVFSLLAIGLLKGRPETPIPKPKIPFVFLTWFFGIWFIGHLFSIYSSPILKYPVMLFPLPFFFLVIGSVFTRTSVRLFHFIFGVLLFAGMTSTLVEKDLFGNQHFGVFEELAGPMVKWRKKYGKDNVAVFMNVSNPNYLNFYAIPMGDSLTFNRHVIEASDHDVMREELMQLNEDYCIVGYSARHTPPQVFAMCREFYPYILEYIKLENCAVFLLGRTMDQRVIRQKYDMLARFDGPSGSFGQWSFDRAHLKKDTLNRLYLLSDSLMPFGPQIEIPMEQTDLSGKRYFLVKTTAEAGPRARITITVTAKDKNGPVRTHEGENFWLGKDLEFMLNEPVGNNEGYFAFNVPDEIGSDDTLIFSLWNRNGHPVSIYRVEVGMARNIWN